MNLGPSIRRRLRALVAAGILLGAGAASAQPTARDERAKPAARAPSTPELSDLRINAGSGVAHGETLSGLAMAGLATFRYSFVEGGVVLEGAHGVFGGTYSMVGGALGPVWQSPRGPRLELLGVAGRIHYSGIGCGWGCQSGGASAELPYFGARAGVSYVAQWTKRMHVEIGASLSFGRDTPKHVEYTTYDRGLIFDTDYHLNRSSTTLGGRRSSALFVIGGNIDLGPR
jgi:hypothetical protein